MDKKFIKVGAIALMMMSGASLNAQVGINNETPQATLDVTAKAPGVSPEGIISPRVTLNDLNTAAAATPAVYGTAQTGAVVYVNDIAGGSTAMQTEKVTAVGYYYFDGLKWQAMSGGTPVDDTDWKLLGNTGTNPATNFVGTIDNQPLVFKVNSTVNGTKRAGYISNMADATNFNSFGLGALAVNSGTNNDAFGYNALAANTTGANNAAFGNGALALNTASSGNSAFGSQALGSTTGGAGSSAFGYKALSSFISVNGPGNDAFGYYALNSNTNGSGNAAFGQLALTAYKGNNSSAFGSGALQLSGSGGPNNAFGFSALYNTGVGKKNCAFGDSTLWINTSGNYNVAFGSKAIYNNPNGSGNVAFGSNALSIMTLGNYNTVVGHNVGLNQTQGSNNILIGAEIDAPILNGSNQINIGNALYGTTSTTQAGGSISIGKTAPDPNVKLDVAGKFQYNDGTANKPQPGYVLTSDDTSGKASWMPPTVKPLATNGLSLTTVNDSVQLGGALTKNTTISAAGNDTLTISAPLAITSGNPGKDKVLVSDSTGNVSWLTLPKLIEKTFIVSKDDNIDRSYTVTNEDLVRLKISTGTEYTLTLPTDPSVTVGRILYVTNVGNGSMYISPLPANNTYQQIDAGWSYIFLYVGNGKWYIVSGF